MNQADPDPQPGHRAGARRFARILRLVAAMSVIVAAIAVLAVMRGEEGTTIHMMIATALGAGLSVMVGGGLMALMFLSNREGHDSAAAHPFEKDDHDR